MNKLGIWGKVYTSFNGDWGKMEENNGSRADGRWWKAATGGVRWRQGRRSAGRNRPNAAKTGETGAVVTAGRR